MDFIWVLEILQKLWLSKNVIRTDWFPHGKVFHWRRVSNQLIVNVCFETGGKPHMKSDRYETQKVISSSGQVYWVFTCSEMIWNSYRLFWPIWNSTPDMNCSAHICSTELRIKTWKMIMLSLKISFVDCRKVLFLIVL